MESFSWLTQFNIVDISQVKIEKEQRDILVPQELSTMSDVLQYWTTEACTWTRLSLWWLEFHLDGCSSRPSFTSDGPMMQILDLGVSVLS